MIAHIRGVLIERSAGHVVVECAGVGYLLHVSTLTLAELPATGEAVSLRVHTHFAFQDGKITLYGFAGVRERQMFELLLAVKGVSPARALPILSGAAPETLARMIASGRAAELRAFKGVGKKTADALVFELSEKCATLLTSWGAGDDDSAGGGVERVLRAATARPHRSAGSPLLDEVAGALLQMGWKSAEVEGAVAALEPPPGASLEGLLRQALQSMPR